MPQTNLTFEQKRFLAHVLDAVINYQDNMEHLETCPDVKLSHEYMLHILELGKKLYPYIFNKYDFGYKKDRIVEFDNLQKFIDDYYQPVIRFIRKL